MAETKYGRYIVKEPLGKGGFFPILHVDGDVNFEGDDFSFRLHYMKEPHLLIKEPHKHDFEQYLCFVSSDLDNVKDFGAEVELYLGEEGVKHIIDVSSIVHIDRGLVHGPLHFKRIDKPVIFLDIILKAKYEVLPVK